MHAAPLLIGPRSDLQLRDETVAKAVDYHRANLALRLSVTEPGSLAEARAIAHLVEFETEQVIRIAEGELIEMSRWRRIRRWRLGRLVFLAREQLAEIRCELEALRPTRCVVDSRPLTGATR